MAVAFAASAAAAECVSVPVAGSVAGAFVLPAVSARRWRSVSLDAGVPVPAAARVSGVPDSASVLACSAVAGISGPVSRFRYLEAQELRAREDPWRRWAVEEHCSRDEPLARCFLVEERCSPDEPPEFRHARLGHGMA